MKAIKSNTVRVICSFFMLLFTYAALSKVLEFGEFQIQLAQSPLLSAYAEAVSYGVIGAELITVFLFCFERSKITALYLSTGIMAAFTVYIYLILNFSDFVPCSCGGILEELGWTEHLIFNIACVILGAAGMWSAAGDHITGRRKALHLGVLLVTASGFVTILFLSSEHIIKKENNFTRRYMPHPVTEEKRLTLPGDAYYFAGTAQNQVWLGNTGAPFLLTSADSALTVLKEMKIKPDHSPYLFRSVRLAVSGNRFYAYDGSVPVIYSGELGQAEAKTLSHKQAYFDQLEATDSLSFGIRTQSSKTRSHVIGLLKPQADQPLQLNEKLLKNGRDGIFAADGQLLQDPATEKLIYLYYYRNEFLVTDYGMRRFANYNTIDTAGVQRVSSVRLPSGAEQMSAPPVTVNKKASAYGGLIFIESDRLGLHEDKTLRKRAAVIDVYSIAEQRYTGSFYLSRPENIKRIQFLATDRHLFVLAGSELIRYRFAQNVTRNFESRGSRKP